MTSKIVPINLEHHTFPQISIVANQNYKPTGKPFGKIPLLAKLNILPVDLEDHRFAIELRVQLATEADTSLPYSLDVLCVAQAHIAGDLPHPEEAARMIADIGHRLLYPAVRELVLSLTARQPWGQFSIGLGVLSTGEAQPAKPGSKAAKRPQRKTDVPSQITTTRATKKASARATLVPERKKPTDS